MRGEMVKRYCGFGYGMFYPLQCITPFYTQNLFQEPTIYFTQTTVNSAVGVGPLARLRLRRQSAARRSPGGPDRDPSGRAHQQCSHDERKLV